MGPCGGQILIKDDDLICKRFDRSSPGAVDCLLLKHPTCHSVTNSVGPPEASLQQVETKPSIGLRVRYNI